MTREEAIDMLHGMRADNLNLDDLYIKAKYEALGMAIEALEQEPCEDAISRAEAILQIQRHGVGCFDPDEFSPEQAERFVINMLNELPSVNPQPKTGHWIPNLMHKEMGIPLIECKKAYDLAIKYLRDKARVKG